MAGRSTHEGHRGRMKRKFLDHGLEYFADHEVLETVALFCDPPGGHQPDGTRAYGAVRDFGRGALCAGGGASEGEGNWGACRDFTAAGESGLSPGPDGRGGQ